MQSFWRMIVLVADEILEDRPTIMSGMLLRVLRAKRAATLPNPIIVTAVSPIMGEQRLSG